MRGVWERAARASVRAGRASPSLPRASFEAVLATLRLGGSAQAREMLRSVYGGDDAKVLSVDGARPRAVGAAASGARGRDSARRAEFVVVMYHWCTAEDALIPAIVMSAYGCDERGGMDATECAAMHRTLAAAAADGAGVAPAAGLARGIDALFTHRLLVNAGDVAAERARGDRALFGPLYHVRDVLRVAFGDPAATPWPALGAARVRRGEAARLDVAAGRAGGARGGGARPRRVRNALREAAADAMAALAEMAMRAARLGDGSYVGALIVWGAAAAAAERRGGTEEEAAAADAARRRLGRLRPPQLDGEELQRAIERARSRGTASRAGRLGTPKPPTLGGLGAVEPARTHLPPGPPPGPPPPLPQRAVEGQADGAQPEGWLGRRRRAKPRRPLIQPSFLRSPVRADARPAPPRPAHAYEDLSSESEGPPGARSPRDAVAAANRAVACAWAEDNIVWLAHAVRRRSAAIATLAAAQAAAARDTAR